MRRINNFTGKSQKLTHAHEPKHIFGLDWIKSLIGIHFKFAILSQRFLLTAAHCVQGDFANPKNVYAVVGTINPSESGAAYPLDRIVQHEKYASNANFNDIAFLRTAKTIVFNELVQPIALASKNTPGELAAYVSGWGLTEEGVQSKYLKFAKTRTMSHKACYDYHKKFKMQDRIIDTSLCAFAGNGDGVCRGDSGKCQVLSTFVFHASEREHFRNRALFLIKFCSIGRRPNGRLVESKT